MDEEEYLRRMAIESVPFTNRGQSAPPSPPPRPPVDPNDPSTWGYGDAKPFRAPMNGPDIQEPKEMVMGDIGETPGGSFAWRHGYGKGYRSTVPQLPGEAKGGPPPQMAPKPKPLPEPFTHQDSLQLQRLNQALSVTSQQVEEGMLSPEEGSQMRQRILKAQMPLLQRQQMQEQAGEKKALQQMRKQTAQMEAIQQANGEYRAQNLQNRVAHIADPITGQIATYIENSPNNWGPVEFPQMAAEAAPGGEEFGGGDPSAGGGSFDAEPQGIDYFPLGGLGVAAAGQGDFQTEPGAGPNPDVPPRTDFEEYMANRPMPAPGAEPPETDFQRYMQERQAAGQPTGAGTIQTGALPPIQRPRPAAQVQRPAQTPIQQVQAAAKQAVDIGYLTQGQIDAIREKAESLHKPIPIPRGPISKQQQAFTNQQILRRQTAVANSMNTLLQNQVSKRRQEITRQNQAAHEKASLEQKTTAPGQGPRATGRGGDVDDKPPGDFLFSTAEKEAEAFVRSKTDHEKDSPAFRKAVRERVEAMEAQHAAKQEAYEGKQRAKNADPEARAEWFNLQAQVGVKENGDLDLDRANPELLSQIDKMLDRPEAIGASERYATEMKKRIKALAKPAEAASGAPAPPAGATPAAPPKAAAERDRLVEALNRGR